jgi:hypothetical protein
MTPGPVRWPQGEIAFLAEDPDADYERPRDSGVTILARPTDRPDGSRNTSSTYEEPSLLARGGREPVER